MDMAAVAAVVVTVEVAEAVTMGTMETTITVVTGMASNHTTRATSVEVDPLRISLGSPLPQDQRASVWACRPLLPPLTTMEATVEATTIGMLSRATPQATHNTRPQAKGIPQPTLRHTDHHRDSTVVVVVVIIRRLLLPVTTSHIVPMTVDIGVVTTAAGIEDLHEVVVAVVAEEEEDMGGEIVVDDGMHLCEYGWAENIQGLM